MSTTAYLSITGAKQGVIQGDVTTKGREGTIAVTAISSQIETQFNSASGTATGKRQHQPLSITKHVDQASPKLYAAMVTNETLTHVTIAFWSSLPDRTGAQTPYFTIKLTNASIVGITLTSLAAEDSVAQTEVRFAYQKISWTWTNGEITAQDDWKAPA
jgi:type VI secretion system secreted protein Hcp